MQQQKQKFTFPGIRASTIISSPAKCLAWRARWGMPCVAQISLSGISGAASRALAPIRSPKTRKSDARRFVYFPRFRHPRSLCPTATTRQGEVDMWQWSLRKLAAAPVPTTAGFPFSRSGPHATMSRRIVARSACLSPRSPGDGSCNCAQLMM